MDANRLVEIERQLSAPCGSHVSYAAEGDPVDMGTFGDDPRWRVQNYSWLGLFPANAKVYDYESCFRHTDHLAASLARES